MSLFILRFRGFGGRGWPCGSFRSTGQAPTGSAAPQVTNGVLVSEKG